MVERSERAATRRRAMIAVLFACNLLASFMQSLVNVALDYVSAQYHVSLSEANLLVLGYSIVAGIVIVLAAISLRRFGLRNVMLFGLVISFAGSLLGVLAWDFPSLVAARLRPGGRHRPLLSRGERGAAEPLAQKRRRAPARHRQRRHRRRPCGGSRDHLGPGHHLLGAAGAVRHSHRDGVRPLLLRAPRDRRYHAAPEAARRRAERRAHCRGAFRLHGRFERGHARPGSDGGAHGRGGCRMRLVRPSPGAPRPSASGHAPVPEQDLRFRRDAHRPQLHELHLPQPAHPALLGRRGGLHAVYRRLSAGAGDAMRRGAVLRQRTDARGSRGCGRLCPSGSAYASSASWRLPCSRGSTSRLP